MRPRIQRHAQRAAGTIVTAVIAICALSACVSFARMASPRNATYVIKNLGDTPLRNPRVVFQGLDRSSLSTIVRSVVNPEMTERERATALWNFVATQLEHRCPVTLDGAGYIGHTYEPLEILNSFGYGCCDQAAPALAALWREAGLSSRVAQMKFHTVPEVFYEGAWHMYDPDHKVFYLDYDNRTVASVALLAANSDLVSRIPDPLNYAASWMAASYEREGKEASYSEFGGYTRDTDFLLEPGAELTYDADGSDIRPVTPSGNSKGYQWSKAILRETIPVDSVRMLKRGARLTAGRLAPAGSTVPTFVYVNIKGPFRIVGAHVTMKLTRHKHDRLVIRVAKTDTSLGWPVYAAPEGTDLVERVDISRAVNSLTGTNYWLIFEMQAADPASSMGLIERVEVESRMQVSRRVIPEGVGETYVYADDNAELGRNVEVRTTRSSSWRRSDAARRTFARSFESASDNGIVSWRAYLAETDSVLEKIVEIPEGNHDLSDCALAILLNGAERVEGLPRTYQLHVTVDGVPVKSYRDGAPGSLAWYRIPVGRELLTSKRRIKVALNVTGTADVQTNYVNVYGSGFDEDNSRFNGLTHDLSPDPEVQRGEYMIRLSCAGGSGRTTSPGAGPP